MRSLRTRIVWSYLLLVILVVFVLGGLFMTLIYQYYYGSAASAMRDKAESDLQAHGRSLAASYTMRNKADYVLQHMAKVHPQIQLLDIEGKLRMDGSGFGGGQRLTTADVDEAMRGKTGVWRGVDPEDGERIIAATVPVKQGDRIVALLRYSASLQQVDAMVMQLFRLTLLTGAVVVLLFLGLSLFMAQRISMPIRELTRSARLMADGDWTRRVTRKRHDEIGQLADTLNTLAVELTKREKLKNDFISSISHELRTPLTSIKGWSETLSDGATDEEEMKLGFAIIQRETERLSGLVEDLLDFSKLFANNMVLTPEEMNLNDTVRESVRQMGVRQEETGVRLVSSLCKMPLIVNGDVNRLKQVLINLLDNAFKFTPSSGIIRVTTSCDEQHAVLTIADTGIGIEPEDLPHVTDKFYKASGSKAGSGLGLAICKEIVELHNGTLKLDSEPGSGTVVTVQIPLAKPEGETNHSL
ncbi:two-component system sensor histidine kinase [Paenibacillus sp. 32O-W]|uniref:histidine kinase n=1 Tax=Paenibacillus cisolokensis TaxID=1658519 RepID=A0ABQ4NE02_9BACL|nr:MULTISPECIES: HAMP domain-containing sensor histidine kinase [Paenibacillus]ALS29995.1 two-component system sensor histidine kinase [Paenibacillus sp. 32O-W]GIQ66462.1 sensor histidine kinase [Paenibacillus cisolokensis]